MAKEKAKEKAVNTDDKEKMVADVETDVTMLTITHVGFLPSGVRIRVPLDEVDKYISTGRARLLKEGE